MATSNKSHNSQFFRLRTYAVREPSAPSLPCALAGFVYDSEHNLSHCKVCGLKVRGFQATHQPLAWHKTFAPNCQFLSNNASHNVMDLDVQFVTEEEVAVTHSELQTASALQQNVTLSRIRDNSTDGVSEDTDIKELYARHCNLRSLIPRNHIDILLNLPPDQPRSFPEFCYERNRRRSFVSWPRTDISTRELAASGFVYQGHGDVVECIYCKVRLRDWSNETTPHDRHIKSSPGCQFVQGSTAVTNVPDVLSDLFEVADDPNSQSNLLGGVGIITEVVKHPEMAVQSRREATFLTWPRPNRKMAVEFINSPLFYKGEGDTVCCFSCGVEMSNWTSVENIWVRHARQSPNCQLLIREKGHDFINNVIEEHGRYVIPAKEPVINIVTTRMLRPRMDSPAAQAVLDMTDPAYRREDVRAALILNIKYGQSDFLYARDLVAAILKRSEDNEQLNHVRQEIELEIPVPEVVQHPEGADGSEEREMETTEATSSDPTVNEEGEGAQREDGQAMSLMEAPTMPTSGRELQMFFTCKVCLENPLGIVFLPCGHFVCCATCAPAMVQCPLCRQEVRGTVRTTFAHL